MKELAIGEIGLIWGVKVQVVEATIHDVCENCAFFAIKGYNKCPCNMCGPKKRKDNKSVYFKEYQNEKENNNQPIKDIPQNA